MQLLKHGFAVKLDGTARFRAVRKFSVDLPTIDWLRDADFPHTLEE
jgi:hypothetical protein